MTKAGTIGNCIVGLLVGFYITFNVVAFAFITSSSSNSQKTSFSAKTLAKGFSLLINEEQEKEKEGDKHENVSDLIALTKALASEKAATKEFPLMDFNSQCTSCKIYLQHCSLQI
jgi:hypothetical protein